MAWQMEQKIPQCFRLIGGTKSLSKNRCSPHENAKIPTLLPRVAIFNHTKLSLMVTWYLIMDNRVEMAPIILWFWLKSIFSPTMGGDYNECNIISWTFDQTATCILVTWLVYIESELHWIVNAPLSPDQRDHRAGSQLKNDITCANHARRISEIRVDKNVNDFFGQQLPLRLTKWNHSAGSHGYRSSSIILIIPHVQVIFLRPRLNVLSSITVR